MDEMGADYWREMGLVAPTLELVMEKQNQDIKFEASVLDSVLTLPEDKILPQDDKEKSFLELRLQSPESGLIFMARFIVSFYIESVGNFYVKKPALAAAQLLNDEIRSRRASSGVFGGSLDIYDYLSGSSDFLNLQLGYAEFPKDSGIVYLFNRSSPFICQPQ